MASQTSLTKLPTEIIFLIFKLLKRPDMLCLSLSSPQFIHLFAVYYNLDQYRGNAVFVRKFGVPDSISWQDPAARGAILRYIAMPGGDDNEHARQAELNDLGGDEAPSADNHTPLIEGGATGPNGESPSDMEEAVVGEILGEWLKSKGGVQGGVVLCAECYRFMRLRRQNGKNSKWAQKMTARPM